MEGLQSLSYKTLSLLQSSLTETLLFGATIFFRKLNTKLPDLAKQCAFMQPQ